jgi:hypothetical protein
VHAVRADDVPRLHQFLGSIRQTGETLTPSSPSRRSRICSVVLCGTINVYGYSVGRPSKSTASSLRSRSRTVKCGTTTPDSFIWSATPRSSSTSSVRACTTAARDVFAPSTAASTTCTSTPRIASPAAVASPVGPAPMTSTSTIVPTSYLNAC